ncbi:MAG TPA: DNA translocase FtsK 4TM domain-containing protein, partial [Terriglobales bacterium]|nr:DNA translocase FtsK 4TM domain-containing protein [Terriglobales bacterium]
MSPRKPTPRNRPNAKMNLVHPFTPTGNRRLNELIGFLTLVFAVLLLLALVSYSPLDPSLNTAAAPPAGRPAHNWIGVAGAFAADAALQFFGIAAFLLPVFLAMYALHWFRSRPISSPYAKTIGAVALVAFLAGFIGLL